MAWIFKLTLKVMLFALSALVLYVFAAWILSLIPMHSDAQSLPRTAVGTDVYVRSNGVHTDIVVPISASINDLIPAQDVRNESGALTHMSFGWGDKGFYLDTPTWADLKASTAFVAAFGLGSTAMHVEAVAQPELGEHVRRVRVTDAQLALIMAHIRQSFIYDPSGKVVKINTTANYNEHDVFYEAVGRYSLLTTCNEWTRNGLSAAQIRTAVFSPHAAGVLQHLPE